MDDPKQRPAVVTTSTALLYVFAGATVLGAVLLLSVVGGLSDTIRQVYAGTSMSVDEVDAAVGVAIGVVVVYAVVNILLAVGLFVLGLLNNRGSRPARVLTWVFGGIAVCCGALGLLGTSSSSVSAPAGNGPSSAELEARLAGEFPGWFTPVLATTSVVSVLALIAAIILLALPASNAYFRRTPPPGWNPPLYQ